MTLCLTNTPTRATDPTSSGCYDNEPLTRREASEDKEQLAKAAAE